MLQELALGLIRGRLEGVQGAVALGKLLHRLVVPPEGPVLELPEQRPHRIEGRSFRLTLSRGRTRFDVVRLLPAIVRGRDFDPPV